VTDSRHDGAAVSGAVYAARLWAGGGAVALVAALIAVVGLLLCRGVLDIPVLAPEGEGAWGDADTASYALVAALVALAATGLMHLLLLFTPRPHSFFGWVMSLTTLAAVLGPFTVTADRGAQVATAAINLLLGIAIGTLVSGSARSACRPFPPSAPGRPVPPRPHRRP
jgi:hypothetical protein